MRCTHPCTAAFDGVTSGASHRDIANVMLGDDAVARQWDSDSELRVHPRHLIKRARHYVTVAV
jgi:hypothetical protein